MRYLNILPGLMMLGFVGVQYNDPDGLLWALYYCIPAAWAFTVAFRPELARSSMGQRLLWASVAVWLGLVVFYWPQMPQLLVARSLLRRRDGARRHGPDGRLGGRARRSAHGARQADGLRA